MKTFEGAFATDGLKFAIVAARFNELITSQLLKGALDGLHRHGVSDDHIEVVWVPGSFEIPPTAKKLAETGKYNAVICLGCVIRGSTAHFDHVAGQAAAGIAQVALETGVPTIFGVLTTENLEQALERAGTKAGNRGFDAALAAIEMANLWRAIGRSTSDQ